MRVLGIESSCDESAAAVVEDGPRLLSNIVYSQVETHAAFGGIVPEVASREHLVRLAKVIEQAVAPVGGLSAIDGIAVTRGPGLVGSLLVGMQMAKGLALARRLPWVGVNHLEGHLSAAWLAETVPTYPHAALVVSGGHTHLYAVRQFGHYTMLGRTRDDAAGEAFDKVAKILGLGYPGGVHIDRASATGDPKAVALPRALPGRARLRLLVLGVENGSQSLCPSPSRSAPRSGAGGLLRLVTRGHCRRAKPQDYRRRPGPRPARRGAGGRRGGQ